MSAHQGRPRSVARRPSGLLRVRARWLGRGSSRSRGQALVELALVTPILLLLLLGAIDLGRLFYAQITVANAAREGAMIAASNPTSFTAGAPCSAGNRVMCAATGEATGSFVTVAPADVALACDPNCATSNGNRVTVTVTGHFQVLTPIIWVFTGGPNVTFNQSATADIVAIPAAWVPATPAPTTPPGPTPTPGPSTTPAPTPTAAPTCAAPWVAFTSSQQNRNRPVVFTSTSTPTTGPCAITYWRWDFGDGTWAAGNLPSTSHDYGSANRGRTFAVTLTVTTPAGTFSTTANITTRT